MKTKTGMIIAEHMGKPIRLVDGSNIAEGAITNSLTSSTKALTHFLFGSTFSKTSSDTLKVIVNHAFAGV
jgi:hypothetical protein